MSGIGVSHDVLGSYADTAVQRISGENFPVALCILPRAVRDDLVRVYAFARFVDELGDSADGGPSVRLALLEDVAADIDRLPDAARLSPVAGLGELVRDYGLPPATLLDLVAANRADQRTSAYESFEELLGYCRLSAAPIGRIVLHRARAVTSATLALSDDVCAALQVLEHCQDVGEDARAGRVYLPQDSLRAAGVSTEQLHGGITPLGLRRVVAELVGRSRALLDSGPRLVSRLHGWARIAVAGYVAGGLATADALAAADFDVLAREIRPVPVRVAGHAARLVVTSLR